MRISCLFLLSLVASGFLGGPSWAGEGDVKRTLEEARAALKAEEFTKARELASKAWEASGRAPAYREAVLIMGLGYLGEGNKKLGLGNLRELLLDLEATVPLDDTGRLVWDRARDAVDDASDDDAALHKKMVKQSNRLVSISHKWKKKDPKAAERAALLALSLWPTSKKALAALTDARKGLQGVARELLDLPDMAGWKGLTDKNWDREEGVLVGQVEKGAMILTSKKTWSGSYDVVMEARLLEAYDRNGPARFAICAPFVDAGRQFTWGYHVGALELYEWTAPREGKAQAKATYAEVRGKHDPKSWVRYELKVGEKEIVALIDGVEVGRAPRAPDLAEGHIVLRVQFCKVEIRSVTVAQL